MPNADCLRDLYSIDPEKDLSTHYYTLEAAHYDLELRADWCKRDEITLSDKIPHIECLREHKDSFILITAPFRVSSLMAARKMTEPQAKSYQAQ